ncbi:uncharacterized protein RT0683-like [Glandiceps talaboti]
MVITIATLEYKFELHDYLRIQRGDCYMTAEQIDDLRFIVKKTTSVFDEMNISYWLDYGTLLGAIRNGDVLRHDTDGDISIMTNKTYKELQEKLQPVGIRLTLTSGQGFYRVLRGDSERVDGDDQVHVDIFKWNLVKGLCDNHPCKKVEMTQKFRKSLNIAVREYETIPLSWIIPTRKIDFADFKVYVPNRAEDVLKNRYPVTYRWTIPYKAKCWLPW